MQLARVTWAFGVVDLGSGPRFGFVRSLWHAFSCTFGACESVFFFFNSYAALRSQASAACVPVRAAEAYALLTSPNPPPVCPLCVSQRNVTLYFAVVGIGGDRTRHSGVSSLGGGEGGQGSPSSSRHSTPSIETSFGANLSGGRGRRPRWMTSSSHSSISPPFGVFMCHTQKWNICRQFSNGLERFNEFNEGGRVAACLLQSLAAFLYSGRVIFLGLIGI